MSDAPVRHFRWSDIPEERVTDVISRKLITGDDMMLAHVYLKKDALVPQHSHHNEQLTYILSGALRFHIMGGPAYAMYHVNRNTGAPSNIGLFQGTRNRTGWAAGGGVSWWLGDRLAIEGNVTDVVTKSPVERSDLPPTATGFELPKTRNVHTTLGVRYRF